MLQKLKKAAKNIYRKIGDRRFKNTDVLYRALYHQYHDWDHALSLSGSSTVEAFGKQWADHPTGEFLLSDPDFCEHVDEILSSQELLLKKEWFKGKNVLDAGCGNGRWAYGLSKMGVNITCADVNASALSATEQALKGFSNQQKFIHTPLEKLDKHIEKESQDLAFSWGVLHHCTSFTKSLKNVAETVKQGGFIYLYLYGRESLSLEEDIRLFRQRLAYNFSYSDKERYRFLLRKAGGDKNKVHNVHDIYAPLINRRFLFEEVHELLCDLGFSNIKRTIDHTELFIRATKGKGEDAAYDLLPAGPPYWFQR